MSATKEATHALEFLLEKSAHYYGLAASWYMYTLRPMLAKSLAQHGLEHLLPKNFLPVFF